ncbi:MAG: CBS domain-containing protein, partial [Cyclobacteriaceae bacterium]
LNADQIIDQELLQTIDKKDFSRIPILRNNPYEIVGILFAKNLISLGNKKLPVTVDKVSTKKDLIWISPSTTLDHLLNLFIQTKSQIALVQNTFHRFLGIITLEDILEVILKKEIDEYV